MKNTKDSFIYDFNDEPSNVLPFEAKQRLEPVEALKTLAGDNGVLSMKSVSQSQLEALSLHGVTSMVRLGSTLIVVPKKK